MRVGVAGLGLQSIGYLVVVWAYDLFLCNGCRRSAGIVLLVIFSLVTLTPSPQP